VHVFGEGLVSLAQDARVVAQAAVDGAGAAALGIDGEAGGEGEGALLQPLRAEQLVAKWLIAIPIVTNPGVKEQMPSGNPKTVPEDVPLAGC